MNILNTSRKGDNSTHLIKLGFVEIQSDSTLTELREKLQKDFPETLAAKPFFFQDSSLLDIEPRSEDEDSVENTFSLSVIIRVVESPGKVEQ